MASPQSEVHPECIHLLWHGVHHRLKCEYLLQQSPPCAAGWQPASPWPSPWGVGESLLQQGCFSYFFPYAPLQTLFLCLLKYFLPEVSQGLAVLCGGLLGAIWNQLWPSQGSPILFSQRLPLQPPLSNTLPHKPRTSFVTFLTSSFSKCY